MYFISVTSLMKHSQKPQSSWVSCRLNFLNPDQNPFPRMAKVSFDTLGKILDDPNLL